MPGEPTPEEVSHETMEGEIQQKLPDRDGHTIDIESDFDPESYHDIHDKLDTDFDL